ncbi:uncharacterized protein LOC130800238 [Amaranthus tricolor]|uniref:uncharacterized protein LOC130800238 n=1 Tax=Amaranthus tricolor TaxID=29722 RepID=UPI00258EB674|nr:uncharacterized protein LOC130800238 [Amaranthus tricolor]
MATKCKIRVENIFTHVMICVMVLSSTVPSEARRGYYGPVQSPPPPRPNVCPACVCCTPAPPGVCCGCCSFPIEDPPPPLAVSSP